MSRIFKAKFESSCPRCHLMILIDSKVRYVNNAVYHEHCAERQEQENNKAIEVYREREGYL